MDGDGLRRRNMGMEGKRGTGEARKKISEMVARGGRKNAIVPSQGRITKREDIRKSGEKGLGI